MGLNTDKFLTPSEHALEDHTGLPGVGGGGGTTIVGAEVIFADSSPSAAGTLFTVAANTLTADNQSLEIVMGFGSGDGATPTWLVELGGQTLFSWPSIPTPGSDGVGQVTMTIFRTGATTGRVVMRGTMGQDGTAAGTVTHALHEVVGTLTADWSTALALTTAFSGGTNESIFNARILKWPEVGAIGISGIGSDTLPVGTIVSYAGTVASIPVGFLPCDGSLADSTVETDLFAVIGTTWNIGGEPGGFFRLPDFRGKSVVGLNDGTLPAGADGAFATRTLAALGGEEDHTLSVAEMPGHSHSVQIGKINAQTPPATGGAVQMRDNGTQAENTTSVGNSNSHNTMHPFAVCPYIIKSTQVGGGLGVSAQNSGGALQGPQQTVNFIPAGGAGVTVVDNPGQNRVDVTLSAPAAESFTSGTHAVTDHAGITGVGLVVQQASVETAALATIAATVPYDDTIPTSAEGGLVLTLPSYTPLDAANILIIDVMVHVGGDTAGNQVVVYLLDGTTTLSASAFKPASSNNISQIALQHRVIAGAPARVYTVRAGENAGSAVGINGEPGGPRRYGGALISSLRVTEMTP